MLDLAAASHVMWGSRREGGIVKGACARYKGLVLSPCELSLVTLALGTSLFRTAIVVVAVRWGVKVVMGGWSYQ